MTTASDKDKAKLLAIERKGSLRKMKGGKINMFATLATEAASKELSKLIRSNSVQKILSPGKKLFKKSKKDGDSKTSESSNKSKLTTDSTNSLDDKENIENLDSFKPPSPRKRRLSHVPSLSSLFGSSKKPKSESEDTPTKHKVKGPNPFKVFGIRLHELMERQRSESKLELEIPIFASKAIEYLHSYGVREQGIFRVSPNFQVMQDLRARIDLGCEINFEKEKQVDCHVVSGLLKAFFREMPDSLLTAERFEAFVSCTAEDAVDLDKLKQTVYSLPKDNLCLAKKLFALFHAVSSNQIFNSMTPQNLAITNAPNLLSRPLVTTDGATAAKEMGLVNSVVEIMIQNYEYLFLEDESTPDDEEPKAE